MMPKRMVSRAERKRAESDIKRLKKSDWKPVKGGDQELQLDDQELELPEGSMFAIGKSGMAYVSTPDGRLIVLPNVGMRTTGGSPLPSKNPHVELGFDGEEMYVAYDGVRIARRESATWISLEPGWVVRDGKNLESIAIEYNGARVH
jgi:hypothetical protein